MILPPQIADDYDDRGVQAVRGVLVEIGQVLGSYRDAIVLVGGSVPLLQLPDARPQHVGTLDVDLDLDANRLGDGRYAEIVELLEQAGYERGVRDLKPFQLLREVPVPGGPSVAVIIDLLMPMNANPKKNRPVLVDGLRVQRCDGADVGIANFSEVRVEGIMPDGRSNSVAIRVATVPALIVMKGFALVGRDKKKDAYDIWFCVRNFPGGMDSLVSECKLLLNQPSALQGLSAIASKFRHEDDFGPATVQAFLSGSSLTGGMTADQIRVDAFRQVHGLLERLGLAEA